MKKILIIAKLSNKKLSSKLLPLINLDEVEKIYLVRRYPLEEKKIINYSPPGLLAYFIVFSEIYRFLSAVYILFTKRIDLIIAFHFKPHGIYAYLLSKIFGVKFGFLITENPQQYGNNKLFANTLKSADFISVRGKNSLNYLLEKKIPREKLVILHNIHEFKKSGKIVKYKDKIYDLIFIGLFIRRKRPDIALEIVSILKAKMPNINVLMIGDGPLRSKTMKIVKKMGLDKNITFIKYTRDVDKYLEESRILFMTSQNEGLPMVVVEAMGHGLPCVVPKVADMLDIARDGYNSVVLDTLDPKQFAGVILDLLKDANKYKKLSNGAYKIMEEKELDYSLERISEEWRKVIIT